MTSTDYGLLLRLAGPLSAYGTHAVSTYRATHQHPTRSAITGMLAAAAGRPHHHALNPFTDLPGQPAYHQLQFTIRTDRPGALHTDYHVTGGGYPRHQLLHTSAGTRRPPDQSALPSHRLYLNDAAFVLALTGPPALIDAIADHLEHPHYAPYLGRRTCVPDEPLVLGPPRPDPVHHLLHHVPLALPTPPSLGTRTVPVTFWWETPPAHQPHATYTELADQPRDLTPHTRHHTQRRIWRTTEHLPARLYAGSRPQYALAAYLEEDRTCPKPA
ncbi:type I-E CRISPR-associated protein Cas5/CasD [Streptomyces sp. CB01635]|uniref:type I-E CRISPR-associated protein Cas5/CasD n=1 Tax=unclassified Streptomyces TaxID=2593676 RepID=UPI000C2757FF|nr:type I-E CRISPR-associated protein Cas5/CasD [Streptomyces sp. CB01635]PJN06096.1 type I-E CRISPR-associated protein Cas5/CasD [Streptomyces sp. CB01635]